MAQKVSREKYASIFGPTTGDRVRLADTELFAEVEHDYTVYGEEVKFGGGKVIRDGMGQSQVTRADGAVDLVVTNANIYTADDEFSIMKSMAIKDGKIVEVSEENLDKFYNAKEVLKCFDGPAKTVKPEVRPPSIEPDKATFIIGTLVGTISFSLKNLYLD